MAFLDEVDSLKTKAHLGKMSPVVLIGLIVVVLVVCFFALRGVWGAAQGDFALEKNSTQQQRDTTAAISTSSSSEVYVYVVGAVNAPGVYGLPRTARVTDAITAAGGFSADAASESLNLARVVADGEQITVARLSSGGEEGGVATGAVAASGISADGKVNINQANLEELKTLDGVGDVTAQKIIDSRESEGAFKTIEDLKRVSGIGDKKYAAIADAITVG